MATNERFMPVVPEAIWAALADPGSYGYWVVGSKVIRDADPEWPAPGTRFHHTVGFGPFKISDHTVALEADPPQRLVLRVKGRPAITARVTLELLPQHGGTLVRMGETPDGIFTPLVLNPLFHVAVKLRNAESLMRLEDLAFRWVR
jgi:uncharacterized protein YndB with AHSA1/START domain